MKKMLLIGIMFLEVLFSYTLIVTQKSDADKLKTVGIKCVYDSVNQNYRCVKSADLLQLKRIKNYMKKEYGIDSYIAQDNYVKNRNTLSETGNIKNVQTDNMNVSKETVINDVPIQTADIPRSGYCIQVASSPFKKGMLKLFAKYADKPLARVEKIGSNYVLRIGESRNYRDIKKLYRQINRGFIRKCDYIPKRIIKSGAAVAAEPVSDTVVIDTLIPKKSKVSVNEMYDALNSGDLIKAKKMAEKLKYTKYANDAYNVLGIVAMKMGKWDEACRYFYKTRNKKLLNTACYTDNLKKGYSVLQRNPKLSLNYFYKAKKYKNTKDIEVGIGYAYLNMKDYKKAEMIFQNLYSRYPEDKDVIKGYAIALYNLKKYDKLKSLGSRLPPKYAKELEKYDVYMDLDRANALIKEQKYDEAENILLNLYNKKPDNISVLLTLGNLYLQKDEPDKAENFFKNVLIINPDNIYALNGLKAVALKRGNYKKALEYVNRLKQLGVNEDDSEIKSMYYMQLAREALKNKNCDEAGKDINVLMNYVQKSADFYMILGDYYSVCKKDSRKAFLNYEKGYQLAKDNFDVKLKFLYSLLNYDMFTQIKIVLGTIDTDNLTPKQKKELRDFYKALYVKYASYKFNNKDYQTAIRVAQRGLSYDQSNPDLYEIMGWSCFRLKKYGCAKENFEKADALKPDDKIKYALALTYMNMGENKKAESILDQIASTDNPELRIKIADAYLNLGKIDKAERVTNSVKIHRFEGSETKKNIKRNVNIPEKTKKQYTLPKKENSGEFFPDVFDENKGEINNYKLNNLYNYNNVKPIIVNNPEDEMLYKDYEKIQREIKLKKSNYLSFMEAGLNIRSKSGTSGTDKLTNLLLYFKGKYYFNYKSSAYFKLGMINLSSGALSDYSLVGSGMGVILNDDWITSYTGFLPKIGYSYEGEKIFNAELGTTPVGGKSGVSSTVTGKLSFGVKKNDKKLLLTLLREPVTDSILSYVGNNDPYSDKSWGRVINNEMKFEYQKTLDRHDSMFYVSFSIAYLKGAETVNNEKYEINLFPLKYIGNDLLNYDYLGVFCMFESYSDNERKFYYPNGGYFSPSYFLLVAPRYEGYLFGDDRQFGLKAFLMGGPLFYKEDGGSSFTLGLEGGVYSKYILQKNLVLKGGLDLRKSTNYTDLYVNISMQYYFGDKMFISKQELNNNLKEMLKTW